MQADGEYMPKVYPKATNTTICSCSDLVFAQCHCLDLGIKFSHHSILTHRTLLCFIQIRLICITGPSASMAVENTMMQLRNHAQSKNLLNPPVLGQLHARLVPQCNSFLRKNFQDIILKEV